MKLKNSFLAGGSALPPVLPVALLLSAGLLITGCGGGQDAPAPTTPAPAPTPAPTPPPVPPPTAETTCTVGLVLRPGESCTYPGSTQTLTVNADGSATFGFITSGNSINIESASLILVATRQSDGSWIVQRVSTGSGVGAGLAPASQMAFDNLVVGKQVTSGDSRLAFVVFIAPGRIREIGDGTSHEGNYVYRSTGSNTGTLTYTYDATGNEPGRERSEIQLTFLTETTGTFEFSYFEFGAKTETTRGPFALTAVSENRAPRPVGSIPDQSLVEDADPTTVNVSVRFSDPDGDALSYRATSSRTSVVRVSVSGSRVTLTPGDAGTATVTVTATDPGGLSATQRFTATVTATGGGAGAGTFRVGDRIPDFPTEFPGVVIGASFSLNRGTVTITMQRGGYVEYTDYRYTCLASSCRIEDGLVTAGEIQRTASGTGGSGTGGSGGGGGATAGTDCTVVSLGTLGERTLTRDGTLGRDCESPNASGKLARFYSFRLAESAEVQIDLTSPSFDTYLTLREGQGVSGRALESDDDGGSGSNARIERDLDAGAYTIEATSFRRDVTGDFTVAVRRSAADPGTVGDAASVEITRCAGTPLVPGSTSYRIDIEGVVRAHRDVGLLTVTGLRMGFGWGLTCWDRSMRESRSASALEELSR